MINQKEDLSYDRYLAGLWEDYIDNVNFIDIYQSDFSDEEKERLSIIKTRKAIDKIWAKMKEEKI